MTTQEFLAQNKYKHGGSNAAVPYDEEEDAMPFSTRETTAEIFPPSRKASVISPADRDAVAMPNLFDELERRKSINPVAPDSGVSGVPLSGSAGRATSGYAHQRRLTTNTIQGHFRQGQNVDLMKIHPSILAAGGAEQLDGYAGDDGDIIEVKMTRGWCEERMA